MHTIFTSDTKSNTNVVLENYFLQNNNLLSDSEGNSIGYIGVTNDITEIENTNGQLRLLKTVLESTANEVVITDNTGEIIWGNSSFNNVTGFNDNEVVGKTPQILKSGLHDISWDSSEIYFSMLLSAQHETRLTCGSGSRI